MIREPRPADLGALSSMLRKMHAETKYSAFSLSEGRMLASLKGFMEPSEDRFGCVFELDGVVSGVFFGHSDELWFSEELCGYDDLIYVLPEARGRMGSIRMLRAFEKWCREKGCSAVLVGVSSGVMVDRTGALFERLGYGRLGGVYRRCV